MSMINFLVQMRTMQSTNIQIHLFAATRKRHQISVTRSVTMVFF
jgi:hypothetical protein